MADRNARPTASGALVARPGYDRNRFGNRLGAGLEAIHDYIRGRSQHSPQDLVTFISFNHQTQVRGRADCLGLSCHLLPC